LLGYGTGNKRDYLAPLGQDGRRAAEACREAVRVTRALLRNEAVSSHGDAFVCEGVQLRFAARPVPLFVAGIGARILTVAGEVADGAIINLTSPRALAYGVGAVRAGAAAAGRAADGLRIVCWAIGSLTNDPPGVYDRLRAFVAHLAAPAAEAVLRAVGFPDDAIGRLKTAYRESGPTAAARHVTDAMCDTWTIIGDGPAIVDRIRQLEATGATDMVILPWSRDIEEVLETARGLARDVLPKLR
jgi:alkanesulfonate monooxygenase SsuD/methylene tetrahydromethanopterin reductase-like flavin-dependent oxidoreductase (luciferase family)